MKYDYETRPKGVSSETAELLVETMPWIKNITGKTILIKYGGAAMVDEKLRADVMSDIILLKMLGVNPVIVHGGGKAISAAMKKENLPVEFIDGQRVTTDEAMKVVRTVLTGEVNQQLVEAMNVHGNLAVGISGTDAGTIMAEAADERLGRVGKVVRVNRELIDKLIDDDYIPVMATIAAGVDGGCYNVNADLVAGGVAAAIGAHKVVFLTDVDGLYEDFDDKRTLISCLSLSEVKEFLASGTIDSGMIPKLTSCVDALEAGVERAHIINGTRPHALLLELLTNRGIGTMVRPDETVPDDAGATHPLGSFASKLNENL